MAQLASEVRSLTKEELVELPEDAKLLVVIPTDQALAMKVTWISPGTSFGF